MTYNSYDNRERRLYRATITRVEKAPLADRKAGKANAAEALKNPGEWADRIGWILNGSYGHGACLVAWDLLNSPRANHAAGLSAMLAALDYSCSGRHLREAWKALSAAEKASLDNEIAATIKDARENHTR